MVDTARVQLALNDDDLPLFVINNDGVKFLLGPVIN